MRKTLRSCELVLVVTFLMFTFNYSAVLGQESHVENKVDIRQIELFIEDYLLSNPEVIEKALQQLKIKREAENTQRQRDLIISSRDQLYDHPGSPIFGKTDARATIVEFFDYRCAYCKKVHSALNSLLQQNTNIRIVYKELPILGPESSYASRFALSAYRIDPTMYEILHSSFMHFRGNLDRNAIYRTSKQLGFDPAAIDAHINDPDITAILEDNYRLAKTLGIGGTPAFIIGLKLIPGAISLDRFKTLIEEQYKACMDC